MRLAVIPARYGSSRFPGKPLADLAGQPLIQRVYTAVVATELVDRVVVATDDERIARVVRAFGGEAVMTAPDHPSGTDRVAEAAAAYPEAELVINVQGDEPFVRRDDLALLLEAFDDPTTAISTLATPIRTERRLFDPNVVKVVCGAAGEALYFSRHALPYLRDVPLGQWIQQQKHLQHIGVYGFRADVLHTVTRLPPAVLEQQEALEQLRWLSAGYRIRVGITQHEAIGVDTPEDLVAAASRYSDARIG